MEPEEKKCAHPLCQCAPEPDSDFCSPACRKAEDETDCCCGHADCRAEA
jgi:hypothetical protein